MSRPEQIKDPTYRVAMEEANEALRDGRYLEVVRKCADSYLSLLLSRPDLFQAGSGMRPATAWPRLGVNLTIDDQRGPDMVWDRDHFFLAEAMTYYEFTLEQLIRASRS